MPPQVHKAGGGAATQQPSPLEEQKDAKSTSSSRSTSATGSTGSATASEPQAQPQTAQEDPKTAAKSHRSSQRHATEKRSQQTMQGQMLQKDLQKKVDKQQPEGLWESMKNTANAVAVESFKKTAQVVDRATKDALVIDAVKQSGAHVMEGIDKAQTITRQHQLETISTEADRAAHGQPNPEYKKHANNPVFTDPVLRDRFLAEKGIYANLKPKFEDSEKAIQKMDQYNRENPESHLFGKVRSDSMEKLLGPYGYYTTLTDPETQKQIQDAALHNWRMTPPEARQALHARDKDSPALQGDYTKNWIKPPRTSLSEEERISKNQVVQNPPLPGAYLQPGYQGPRESRPDPGQVYEKGKYDLFNAELDVLNSMGGGVAAKGGTSVKVVRIEPRPSARPNLHLRTAPSQTTGQAKGGGPLDKTQYQSAYEPTVQRQEVPGREAWESAPPADAPANRGPQKTIEGNPPPPPRRDGPEDTLNTKPPAPAGRYGKGYTLPGKLTKGPRPILQPGVPRPEIPWLPKKGGVGLTHDQVYEIHKIDSGRIEWSMNATEHLNQYKNANPKHRDGDIVPMAFTTRDGKVVVNEDRWVRSGEPALWGMEIVDE